MKLNDTWTALVAELDRTQRVLRHRPEWIGLVWKSSVPMRIERVDLEGEPRALVIADIGPAQTMSLHEVMALNLTFAAGAYALESERVVLRAHLPLAAASIAAVGALLDQLGVEAARLRARISQVPPDPEALMRLFAVD